MRLVLFWPYPAVCNSTARDWHQKYDRRALEEPIKSLFLFAVAEWERHVQSFALQSRWLVWNEVAYITARWLVGLLRFKWSALFKSGNMTIETRITMKELSRDPGFVKEIDRLRRTQPGLLTSRNYVTISIYWNNNTETINCTEKIMKNFENTIIIVESTNTNNRRVSFFFGLLPMHRVYST